MHQTVTAIPTKERASVLTAKLHGSSAGFRRCVVPSLPRVEKMLVRWGNLGAQDRGECRRTEGTQIVVEVAISGLQRQGFEPLSLRTPR